MGIPPNTPMNPPLENPADIEVLSGPHRPPPTYPHGSFLKYLGGTLKTFATVCLEHPVTALIVIDGLGRAAFKDKEALKILAAPEDAEYKPAEDVASPAFEPTKQKKVAPFHRVPVMGGRVECVQAWTKGEARAKVRALGFEIDKAPVREKRAA